MEENSPEVVPVSLMPKKVYGLRKDVIGNVKINFNHEIIYPVEQVLVFQDSKTHEQRFLRFPENTLPKIMSINPTRRLLAIVESTTTTSGNELNLAVYDTDNLKKRRNFHLSKNGNKRQIAKIEFIADSRGIIALTEYPNQFLYMMLFDEAGTILEHPVDLPNQRIALTYIAVNSYELNAIAVAGDGLLKIMSTTSTSTGFVNVSEMKFNLSVICVAWLSIHAILLGLKRGKLAVVENGELKYKYNATEVSTIDLLKDEEAEHDARRMSVGLSSAPVSLITAQQKCLAYVVGSKVFYFEKVSKMIYERMKIITLHETIFQHDLYIIKNISIHPNLEKIVITAAHSQIYEYYLNDPNETMFYGKFKPLGELIHNGEIVDMAVCAWRSIIMTASKDQTIRIWNYETEQVELVKKFQIDIEAIELNATGQFAAIAFEDQLRVMQIFIDDLSVIKTYNFQHCSVVKYSFFGHLMAAAYQNLVAITSVYNLNILRTLKGHYGKVMGLAWSRDDKYLISGGAEGAIYQWETETGVRLQEIVQKGTEYYSLCCSKDPFSIFALTNSGYLRELNDHDIISQYEAPKKETFTSLALAKSDLIMFASTDTGNLYNVRRPFDKTGKNIFTNYRFFDSAVTKVLFSYDGTLLITGSKNGTLVIWYLQNIDGRVAPIEMELLRGNNEVIIPRNVLKEKNDLMANLELRLVQQSAEFQYQESQSEIFGSQKLSDLHKSYFQAFETLKANHNILELRQIEDLNEIMLRVDSLKNEHRKEIKKHNKGFARLMLEEIQSNQRLSESFNKIQSEYEQHLRMSAAKLQDTVEALEIDFKKELRVREDLIRSLLQELHDLKFKFNELNRHVVEEQEKHLMRCYVDHENNIKIQQQIEIKWRGEAGLTQLMSDNIKKKAQLLIEEVESQNQIKLKSNNIIENLNHQLEFLHCDLADCDFAINIKENRIQELFHVNRNLEMYKQLLLHEVKELKMLIEPLECEINEKRKQIIVKEQKLDALHEQNNYLEVEVNKFRKKHQLAIEELKKKSKSSKDNRKSIDTLLNEIYKVAGTINDIYKLRSGILGLIKKYGSNESLRKRFEMDNEVRNEFKRQMAYLTKSIKTCRCIVAEEEEKEREEDVKLHENMNLMKEYEELRKKVTKAKKDRESVIFSLNLRRRHSHETKFKISNTLEHVAIIKKKYKENIDQLIEQRDKLQSKDLCASRTESEKEGGLKENLALEFFI